MVRFQQGDSGDQVEIVQGVLRSFGFDVAADGNFGAQTCNAVKAFQKQHDLSDDGVIGPETLEAMDLDPVTLGDKIELEKPDAVPDDTSDDDNSLSDTKGGRLFVDYYQGDRSPDLAVVAADQRYAGAIVKATEGLYYNGGDWFPREWSSIHDQERYGETWFRGCYHFLKFNQDGAAQADFYLKAVDAPGGWDHGDLWPVVDVELGGEKNSNRKPTAKEIIECTTQFATRVALVTGRNVMLYGNGAMRDLSIKDRMGCDWLWCPRYTATLPRFIYERAGWSVEKLIFWQYAGDGTGFLAGYPTATPDGKKIDHSALVLAGGVAQLAPLL